MPKCVCVFFDLVKHPRMRLCFSTSSSLEHPPSATQPALGSCQNDPWLPPLVVSFDHMQETLGDMEMEWALFQAAFAEPLWRWGGILQSNVPPLGLLMSQELCSLHCCWGKTSRLSVGPAEISHPASQGGLRQGGVDGWEEKVEVEEILQRSHHDSHSNKEAEPEALGVVSVGGARFMQDSLFRPLSNQQEAHQDANYRTMG